MKEQLFFQLCISLLSYFISVICQVKGSEPGCNFISDSVLNLTKLVCQSEAINVQYLNSNFSSLSQHPQVPILQIQCNSYYYGSSFAGIELSGSLRHTQSLTFRSCKFDSVPNSIFQNMTQLEYLEISETTGPSNLHLQITADSLKGLGKLRVLNLNGNGVKSLGAHFFLHVPNIQLLNLSANNLNNTEAFGINCNHETKEYSVLNENLSNLDLSGNDITTWGTFCAVPNLKSLNLTRNMLSYLPLTAFKSLRSLEILDLSRNKIQSLPEAFAATLPNLTHIDLSGNFLISFPNFNSNPYLVSIAISENKIVAVDRKNFPEINATLQYLDLSNNAIVSLLNSPFSALKNLVNLYLSNNKLKSLSFDVFSNLSTAICIKLDGNSLREIHQATFGNCHKLVRLYLSGNQLTEFPNLSNLTDLQILDLGNNSIQSISNTSISAMKSIVGVKMSDNQITSIDNVTFMPLVNLSYLNLAYNSISEIQKGSFHSNEILQYLRLDHNHLRSVDGVFMHYIPNYYLNLSHNFLPSLDFSHLPFQLDILDISNNLINHLTDETGILMRSSFKEIYLSHNKLSELSKRIVPPNTVRFDASHNNISKVDTYAFYNLQKLTRVNLEANSLRTIQLNSLRIKYNDELGRPRLKLGANIFFCDCDVGWLRNINLESKKDFFRVEDVNYIYCKRHYAKGSRPFRLVTAPAGPEDFLCPFTSHTFSSVLCYQHGNRSICDYICPEKCDCYRDQPWANLIVDCDGRNLTRVPSNVPVSVSRFDLQRNELRELDESTFEDLPKLTFLHLNNSRVQRVKDNTFRKMLALKELHLNGNQITELRSGVFSGLFNLTVLHLHDNLISRISNLTFWHLVSLRELTLSGNRLTTWPVWVLDPVPSKVTLSANPWSCDCDYVTEYRNWLQDSATALADVEDIVCEKPDNSSVSLINYYSIDCINVTTMNFTQAASLSSQIPLLAGIVATFLVMVTVSILIFKFRREMQVYVYSRYGVRLFERNAQDDDAEKAYDAFVCYSNGDEDFVADVLAPCLERDNGFKLCLHHRDFAVGAYITESIMEAVERSRRTILVLSDNFISSEWCRFEFKSAHLQMMKDRRNRVILIVYGDIPADLDPEMKLYLKTNTYLEWGDRLFWHKLRFAMPNIAARAENRKPQENQDINMEECGHQLQSPPIPVDK